MSAENLGLDLVHDGHRTRLKWHRLRCSLSDPLFSATTMARGFELGASMELDLRVRADGGFVVLHDARLEGETTGQGRVCDSKGHDIRNLHLLAGGQPPILSEDLTGHMTAAHPQALLQFDMKDDLATIGEQGLAHLEEHFADLSGSLIISAMDLDLIVAIANRMPDIRRGIDPTHPVMDALRSQGPHAAENLLLAAIRGATDPDTVYLSWPLLLEAHGRGLDLIALCHAENRLVDAWTFNLAKPDAGFSDVEWQQISSLMSMKPDQITTDEAPATERAWNARLGA